MAGGLRVPSMRIAAETVSTVQSNGIRAGQRVARPPMTVPGKWIHGLDEESDLTLCGRPLDDLYVEEFPSWDFNAVAGVLKCRDCIAAAAADPTAG